MKAFFHGFILSFAITFGTVSAVSAPQAPPKIVNGQNWALCLDVTAPSITAAQAYSYTIKVGTSPAVAASGMIFQTGPQVGTVTVKFPHAQMPTAVKTVGTFTVTLAATSSGSIILADGSVFQPTPSSITHTFEVLDPNLSGPQLGNPRWERIGS